MGIDRIFALLGPGGTLSRLRDARLLNSDQPFLGPKQSVLLGCLGSTATLTMGAASKLSGMNGGQQGMLQRVADFSTKSWRPPIPAGAKSQGSVKADEATQELYWTVQYYKG